MKKTLKDLCLALINATLILIALCLFLLWQLSGTAKGIVADFAENLNVMQPLTDEVRGLRTDLAQLKADAAAFAQNPDRFPESTAQAIDIRLAALGTKLDGIQVAMSDLAQTPDRLMTTAIDRSTARLAQTAYDLRGCTSTGAAVIPETPAEK
ncbi:hypothetical protein [Shimia abyssi]|uniref:Uncharacterized protein n=1 Tax=Shimia abyssi TaxID=1662395 RepID=A0A2P8FFX6_9RHOB|nr:hypothetical protein [Shimia abyssi]PSL20614.1 hypothetical protein CLV88_103262 [Shimia abyssi]